MMNEAREAREVRDTEIRTSIYLSGSLCDTISTLADVMDTTPSKVMKLILKQWYYHNLNKIRSREWTELATDLEQFKGL